MVKIQPIPVFITARFIPSLSSMASQQKPRSVSGSLLQFLLGIAVFLAAVSHAMAVQLTPGPEFIRLNKSDAVRTNGLAVI